MSKHETNSSLNVLVLFYPICIHIIYIYIYIFIYLFIYIYIYIYIYIKKSKILLIIFLFSAVLNIDFIYFLQNVSQHDERNCREIDIHYLISGPLDCS